MFAAHQLFSMIGILALAPIALFSLVPALRLFGSTISIRDMQAVLTQMPGFPVQIVIWTGGRFLDRALVETGASEVGLGAAAGSASMCLLSKIERWPGL